MGVCNCSMFCCTLLYVYSWPYFVMFLFVLAHKVRWFSILTLFWYAIVCCCSQNVIVLCFDIFLWCYCLLLRTKCDGFVFEPVLWCYCLLLLTECDGWVFWPCFVMFLLAVAHKVWWFCVFYLCIWPCFVMVLFVVAHKIWWFSGVFDLILWCNWLLLLTKDDGLVFWPDFVMLLLVVAHKV